ncbi:MAG: glutamate racemase [Lachnospiraceae bacterium]|nr:glutamate racemase [Lachnospiraceae bacterium]MBR3361774.1 glutamate racemase [Lachnospiraceae bacterium]MBR7075415.1 glutamate racemase [Lachnospiraceae bacterium]MDO4206751.1 glutamate racemase [Lachnospiraceae bacterium]
MDTKNANAELRNLPIGVFDSGVGGLTVAREIFRNLPNEKIIYFGDTARVPYGNKSKETIIRYSRQISKFLLSQNVKAIVIACNTASALALNELKEEVDVPVIGVVEPGARAAAAATKNGRIGVIGTEGTINSGLYTEFIKKIRPDCEIFGQPCPLFVSLVEEGMIDDEVTITMIHRYLDKMIEENNIDALILGCTHYPLLRTIIAREIGDGITLVNPAYETAQALKGLLSHRGLESSTPCTLADHSFFVSDGAMKFQQFASSVLELDIQNTKLKILE